MSVLLPGVLSLFLQKQGPAFPSSLLQYLNVKELNLVVKADVQGSVEAVKQSLLKLSNEEVVIKVIHAGVGAINESDVLVATKISPAAGTPFKPKISTGWEGPASFTFCPLSL